MMASCRRSVRVRLDSQAPGFDPLPSFELLRADIFRIAWSSELAEKFGVFLGALEHAATVFFRRFVYLQRLAVSSRTAAEHWFAISPA